MTDIISWYDPLDDTNKRAETPKGINVPLKNHQKAALFACMYRENPDGFMLPFYLDSCHDTDGKPVLNKLGTIEKKVEKMQFPEEEMINVDTPNEYFQYVRSKLPYNPVCYSSLGIISDKVGSGKSLVVLSLIAQNKCVKFDLRPKQKCTPTAHILMLEREKNEKTVLPINIIVVPHNIVTQWENYVKEQTDFKYKVYSSASKKTSKKAKVGEEKETDIYTTVIGSLDEIRDLDVVIVSLKEYGAFQSQIKRLLVAENAMISRLFFDEAHIVCVKHGVMFIDASFVWLISASIADDKDICNVGVSHMGQIKDSLLEIGRAFNKGVIVRNLNNFVDQSLQLDVPNEEIILCRNNLLHNIISGIMSENISTLLLEDNLAEIMSILNIETFSIENVLKKMTANFQDKLHNLEQERKYKVSLKYASEDDKKKAVAHVEKNIKTTKERIKSFEERIKDNNIDPIMMCEIETPVLTPCCHNKYDLNSLMTYICHAKNAKCPTCRANFEATALIHLADKPLVAQPQKNKVFNPACHAKPDVLKWLLETKVKQDAKVLIFSNNDVLLSTIREIVASVGRGDIKDIRGTQTHIDNTIHEYKTGNVLNTLFLNATHYGCGLNLENTDVVILMHRMETKRREQTIGRAQRLGRTSKLQVYELHYQNE